MARKTTGKAKVRGLGAKGKKAGSVKGGIIIVNSKKSASKLQHPGTLRGFNPQPEPPIF
jgi:hypothetical protein